jgi:cation diffusion facilitator family transporter
LTKNSGDNRRRAIQRVLVIEMALNLLVAAAKGVYGLISGSLAIVTDSIHSVVDAANNVVGIVLIGVASAPPDESHPYGHRKIEVIAATVIGLLIAGTAITFARDAISALIEGREAPATSVVGFAVIIGTMIVNIGVATYESRKAKELSSSYLHADAAHTASDVLVTAAVLASYTATHFGVDWADPVGALLVLVFVGRVAYRIILDNLGVLADQASADAPAIRSIAEKHPQVIGCHRVRSRGPSDAVLVDMHLVIRGQVSLRDAHDIAHEVEDSIREQMPGVIDVVVHTEPEGDGEEPL